MAERKSLDLRHKAVLYFIIESFSKDGLPVGSRLISKQLKAEQLSPASIRNVMADLEEIGLLDKPHVSSGRVPTDSAYRLMVEDILLTRSFKFKNIGNIEAELEKNLDSISNFFNTLSKELSAYTGCIGIVLSPDISSIKCRNIHFIKIDYDRILAVFISSYGLVYNKLITTEENFTQDQLERIANLVNEHFGGMTVSEMLRKINDLLKEDKTRYDTLLQQALDLSGRSFEHLASGSIDIYHSGTEQLLDTMFFEERDRMINIYRAFEDKALLLNLLRQCLKENEINVIIGSENLVKEFADFSIVSAAYSSEGRHLGKIAVLGPKRMKYGATMGVVYNTTRVVSKLLTESGF